MRSNRHSQHVCDEVQEQFDLCELGLEQLDIVARTQMESHIEDCDGCQKWLSEWELVKLGVQQLPQMEVPTSVLANIMSRVDPAPAATPAFVRSDVLITVAGLALLVFASLQYGAEGVGGTAAWCLSFLILFAANQLFKFKDQESGFAT